MDDQTTQISELFAAPRGDLKIAANFGGVKIYTSTVLQQNFIKAMVKTSRVSPIVPTLIKLMQKGEFIPCYLTDKILKTILKRQPPEFKGYAGLTLGKFILTFVDNETNIFGFTSNNELSVTTLHELIHKASNKNPKLFYQTFKTEFTLFYNFYWSRVFSVERSGLGVKETQNLVEFIYFTTESGDRSNKALSTYYRKLLETFQDITTLNKEELDKLVTQYIILIKIIWKAMSSSAPTLIEKAVFANRSIIVPLYTAYKTAFGINVKSIKELCYQELYAPSEVISLPALVKRPSAKVYKMVNTL